MSISICYAAIYLLEACILWQYCRNLFTSKYSRQREAFFLLLGYSVLFAGSLLDDSTLNLVLFFLVNLIYLFAVYRIGLLTALFHALFVTISMMLSELCIVAIFTYFGMDFYGKGAHLGALTSCSIISKLLYFMIPLLSAFIAFVLANLCATAPLSFSQNVLLSVSSIMLLAINLLTAWFHTSIQEKDQQLSQMQLILQKERDTARYFDALQQEDEKQKILVHDIRRHLSSIAELNEKGDTEKISAYIHQLIQSSDLQVSVRLCDNTLLNTILYRTRQQCKADSVSFLTDIRSGCVDFLSDYDLTALFSNLLENATDATKDIPGSYIELNVTPRSDTRIMITMINSCRENPFSKDGSHFITTKNDKEHHGYGMKSIQRVIDKYGGDSHFYFDEETYTVHSTILLKRAAKATSIHSARQSS